jgi:hypothetical protein
LRFLIGVKPTGKKLAEKLLEVEVANKRAMALTQRLAELQIEIHHANQALAGSKISAQEPNEKAV